jgi:tripartite ATP-independent transporter DctM subunit
VSWLLAPFLILMALLGAPLFVVLACLTLSAFRSQEIDSTAVAIEMYRLAESPMLIAIPLFTFAGYLLAESGAPRRLVTMSRALLGWMPGGLALVALVACALFTAFTGASGVTIIAMGGLLLPAMRSEKYPQVFTHGLLTTSGSLGLLFPPSLPIIILAYVASVSVDQLFVAGVIPGLLLIFVLGVYAVLQAKRSDVPRQAFAWRELGRALRHSALEVPLPFLILGGIYGGKITVTEAASITAVYAIIVEVGIYRDVKLRDLPRVFTESMVLVGGILIILATALSLTNYLIDAEVPTTIFEWIQTWIDSKRLPDGHLLRDSGRRATDPAGGAGVRRGPRAPGDHLPHEPRDRLLDTAGWTQPFHRFVPLRQAGRASVPGVPAVPGALRLRAHPDHVPAGALALARPRSERALMFTRPLPGGG